MISKPPTDVSDLRRETRTTIQALQTTASRLLKQEDGKKRDVTIEIRVTLDAPEPETSDERPWCYTHHYVGGHLADGTPYYVAETQCIEVQGMDET
jgi:hypothetical protein